MKRGTKSTKAEKIEIAEKICLEYSKGGVIFFSVLKYFGVNSESTWKRWCDEIEEIEVSYKKAKIEARQNERIARNERIRRKALSSFERMIEGYEVEEIELIFDANDNLKYKKVKKKFIQPNPTLVQIALYNRVSEDYKNKQNIKHSGQVKTKAFDLSNLSKAERQKLKDARKLLESDRLN